MSEHAMRPGARVVFGAVVAACLLSSAGSPAQARIFAYTDNQGRIRIQDLPDRDGAELALPRIGVPYPTRTIHSARSIPARRVSYPAVRRDPAQFRESVKSAADMHRLSESLIFAVMRAESNFNPYAVSSAGAQGLMQLIPSTAKLVGVVNIFDPHENIHGGAKYLRMMLDRFGRLDLALAAYNAGPEAVERYGGIPPFAETLAYVPRVMRYYRQYGGTGELILSSARDWTPSPAVRSRGKVRPALATWTSRASGTLEPTVAHSRTPPLWYYRGPDGQIYISNIRN